MATVVVTGANRGIGLELVRQFQGRGDHVIALCRNASVELTESGAEIVDGIDVSDDGCVPALTEKLAGRDVDILVNNAGVLTPESFQNLDFDRMRRQYEVNSLGPLRVTKALYKNLHSGSKVGIVSSRVGSLADNSSGGMYGYRVSKAAVNMVGVNLAHDLKPDGITVVILHPGYVKTGMTKGQGNTDAATAAHGLIDRIDNVGLEQTGSFWHAEGYELPW